MRRRTTPSAPSATRGAKASTDPVPVRRLRLLARLASRPAARRTSRGTCRARRSSGSTSCPTCRPRGAAGTRCRAAEAFAAAAGRAGIGDGVFVVAYDHGGAGGAARLWWLLRHFGHEDVAVLRGGIDVVGRAAARRRGGGRAARVRPARTRTATRSRRTSWPRGSASRVSSSSTRGSPERYRGEAEPIDPVAGRIPGAVNWPYPEARSGAGGDRRGGRDRRLLRLGDHRVRESPCPRAGGPPGREALSGLVERMVRARPPGRDGLADR